MASVVASSAVISPAAFAAATPAIKAGYAGLKPSGLFTSAKGLEWSQKTVGNGSRVNCMQVWEPFNNKKYETLSYLPPLSSEGISKEIDYMINKGWFPCLEFCDIGYIYREHFQGSGYYDGRYWTMWKLPMFGCQDSAAVLREIEECKKAYPKCFVRVLGFDNKRQVQCAGFIVYNPESS